AISAGQIVLLQRREPRIFYPDHDAALQDLYPVDPGDICPRTRRINRMGGLRGYGREMWRRITRRPETSPEQRGAAVPIQQLSAATVRALVEEAALVVPCFGYRSATLPVFGASGERQALSADADGVAVGDDSRLMLQDGTTVQNLFGIGLGTGYRL